MSNVYLNINTNISAINFFGIAVSVPNLLIEENWHVAIDFDGNVYAYKSKPALSNKLYSVTDTRVNCFHMLQLDTMIDYVDGLEEWYENIWDEHIWRISEFPVLRTAD